MSLCNSPRNESVLRPKMTLNVWSEIFWVFSWELWRVLKKLCNDTAFDQTGWPSAPPLNRKKMTSLFYSVIVVVRIPIRVTLVAAILAGVSNAPLPQEWKPRFIVIQLFMSPIITVPKNLVVCASAKIFARFSAQKYFLRLLWLVLKISPRLRVRTF